VRRAIYNFSVSKVHWRGYQGDRAIDEAFWYMVCLARPLSVVAAGSSWASDNTGADPAVQKESICFISAAIKYFVRRGHKCHML